MTPPKSSTGSSPAGKEFSRKQNPRALAPINPDMLAWVRISQCFTREQVADRISKLTINELTDFESGRKRPAWNLLQQFADLYKRPLSFFFLSQVPITDRRSVTSFRVNYNDGSFDEFPVSEDDDLS